MKMVVTNGSLIEGNEIEENKACKSKTQSPLHCLTPSRDSLNGGTIPNKKSNFFSGSPFHKLGSTSSKFWEIAAEKDELSRAVLSSNSHGIREKLSGLAHKITWDSLKKVCNEWFRNPMNLALFVWIVCVAVSGGILFLVMTGMLNGALPNKSQRNAWFEVNNQILNALFTLMCLYQHPKRCYHLVMLLRWNQKDISRLRKIYCKNGTYKPHEWAHMLVVILLLQLNCFAQYALCGLNVGYKRSERPAIGVGICVAVAIAAPAMAGIYSIASPLGKEYDSHSDEEAQLTSEGKRLNDLRSKSIEKKLSFMAREDEKNAEWAGGIFDFWDDISIAYLSLFCSFCVFGWNMERLGFGNMYVHIATFVLFCTAPFWIFNLAAININNEIVQQALGLTGVLLCLLGLLYGGYWRLRMRKRFNLPEYTSCCGKPAVSDFAVWLCCCWCSLAQEVRTANFYEIVEDKMCRKHDENHGMECSEIAREAENGGSHLSSHLGTSQGHVQPTEENSKGEGMAQTMTPPSLLKIDRESK